MSQPATGEPPGLRGAEADSGEDPRYDGPVILFDGVCGLCESTVRFTLKRDHKAIFRFAPLQGPLGRRVTSASGLPGLDSIVLIDEEGVHTKSGAALRIVRRLGPPWVFAAALLLVPRRIRDAVYDLVARNRYRWFGRRDSCVLPEGDERDRFISDTDPQARGAR